MNKHEVIGSGPGFYKNIDVATYRAITATPAGNEEYFKLFHQPIIEHAKKRRFDSLAPIHVFDIACGPADELQFIKNDPDVQIIATDIALDILPFAKSSLGNNAKVFASDASFPAFREGIAEAGILVNALAYVPDKVLEAMYRALKPGGQCVANFRIFSSYDQDILDSFLVYGGKILDEKLIVQTKNGEQTFSVKLFDFRETLKHAGVPDLAKRSLGQQLFFQSIHDIRMLINLIGFTELKQSQFTFPFGGNPNNEFEVFTLEKPDYETSF